MIKLILLSDEHFNTETGKQVAARLSAADPSTFWIPLLIPGLKDPVSVVPV